MRRLTLAILLLFIVFHAPWRLMALTAETFLLKPGQAHLAMDNERYWEAIDLETRLVSLGWEVTYMPNPHWGPNAVYGLTSPDHHSIVIDATLGWSARAAILAHEGGHTLQPLWMGRIEGDCFAEAVAALVVHDGLREHARWMSNGRWTCLGVAISEYPNIYRAAAILTH